MSAQIPDQASALSPGHDNALKTASSTDASSTTSPNGSSSTGNNAGSASSNSQVSPPVGDALDAPRPLVCRWNQCGQKFTTAETLYVSDELEDGTPEIGPDVHVVTSGGRKTQSRGQMGINSTPAGTHL